MSHAITKHCKKPCHDCPFRTDILRYQSKSDVVNNIRGLLDPFIVAHCHHTERQPLSKKVACAGFLTTLRSIGNQHDPRLHYYPKLNHNIPCYESLEDFLDSACPTQTVQFRIAAWTLNQPLSKRKRLLQETRK